MKELEELGLSENEITIYLTLLKIGRTTANTVAKISGMKRSTTYDNLQLLISRGIASTSLSDSVSYYVGVDPQKLIHILEDKVRRVRDIVPELEKLRKTVLTTGGVTYFEGKKGVLTVLNDVLDTAETHFYYIGSRKMAKIPLKHYPDNFARRRVESKITLHGILAQEDEEDTFVSDVDGEAYSEIAYKKKLNGSQAIMFAYKDKISFITNREDPVGVIIENKEIAHFMKSILF